MDALAEGIRRGEHHCRVFEIFRPGFDSAAAGRMRRAAGDDPGFRREHRRGRWADVQRHWPQAAQADIAIDTLAELPGALPRCK